MLSSVVGFYSSPLFTRLLPERQDTPLTKVRAPPGVAWLSPCPCALCGVPTRGHHASLRLPLHPARPREQVQDRGAVPRLLQILLFFPPQIIGNCVSLLVLSSALPVFSRTLGEMRWGWGWDWGSPPGPACPDPPTPCHAGITRFDLLGDFGRFNWLGNFYIVFLYNMGFAALTTLCLVKKVTWAVQEELLRAFGEDGDGGDVGQGAGAVPCLPLTLSLCTQVCTSCRCPCPAPGPWVSAARAGGTRLSHPLPENGHGAGPDAAGCVVDAGDPPRRS